jgi:hypothetical protein
MPDLPKRQDFCLSSRSSSRHRVKVGEWLRVESRAAHMLEGVAGIVFIVFVILAVVIFLFMRARAHALLLH